MSILKIPIHIYFYGIKIIKRAINVYILYNCVR